MKSFLLMSRRWHPCSPGNAAHSALASDDAAQPSSLAGSAEQPADESYRRAWDGELYTRAEFHEHYGLYLGEARWQSNAEQPVASSAGLADVIPIGGPRLRSAEQPAASLHRAAQLASNVHSAAHATHTEYMMCMRMASDIFVL